MRKSLDCVEMKRELQQKLMKKYAGLSFKEKKQLMDKSIAEDPVLGPWIKNLPRSEPVSRMKVAEERTKYADHG